MKDPAENEVAFPQVGNGYNKQEIVIFLPTENYDIPNYELGIKREI